MHQCGPFDFKDYVKILLEIEIILLLLRKFSQRGTCPTPPASLPLLK